MGNEVQFPKAYRFLFEPAPYKIAYGGRGAARSWSCARALLLLGLKRPLRVLCAREFQKSIQDSVHKLLEDQIRLLGLSGHYDVQRSTILGPRGTSFIFEGLRHNVTKIKSLEGIDVCWVEEAEKVSADSWDVLVPTIRKEDSEIWITFNPDSEDDPTLRRFVKQPPPGAVVCKTTWRDNPFLTEKLRREKDYLWRVDPDRASYVWDGECRAHSDAQVLKGKWRVDAFEPAKDWDGPYYGADWGYVDPNTLIRFWLRPDGGLMIEHEAYEVGVDLGPPLAALWDTVPDARSNKIRADAARPETIRMMQSFGFDVEGAPKWPGSVEDGVSWLRARPEIVIHDRCANTISEARDWKRKVDRNTGDVREELEDKHNHSWDAIRYGAAPMIQQNQAWGVMV
jgi:phage terminase large subunit